MYLSFFTQRPAVRLAALALTVATLTLAGCGARPQALPTETPGPAATSAPTQAPATNTAAPAATTAAPPPATATVRASPTAEAIATEGTASAPTPEAGATLTGTVAAETPAGGTAVPEGVDKVDFVSDVTVPDGTDFAPGEAFVKTWRLRNSGTTTWTAEYDLAFIRGEQMGGPASVPLSDTVAPGETIDLSVSMVAPTALGNKVGFWQLRNAQGVLFGGGAEANEPIYVQIDVVPAGSTTPGAASTAAPGGLRITGTSISVDRASASGACPQTFRITASFTSEGAGTVTYRLEAAASTPGFTFNLPEAFNGTFTDAGPRTFAVPFTLEFTNSVNGEAWLHITAPQDVTSDRVSFSLTCTPGAAASATP